MTINASPIVSSPIDSQLGALVRSHRDRFYVHYGTDALTDHGPMASLALAGLHAPIEAINHHASSYERRLDAQHANVGAIDADRYPSAVGRFDAYAALIGYFDRQIGERGIEATLHHYLPGLISGWVKDAYHAVIRLGYGIEFGMPSEIAAGLAYLAALGPDPQLAAQAAGERTAEPLAAARSRFRASFGNGTFAQRYRRVVQSGVIDDCMPSPTDTLRRASRAALRVFDSTHGFFALHLVTGCHAMRVCLPFAGASAERLLWGGVVAGYLCIGAPAAGDTKPSQTRSVAPDIAIRDPEHLIKIAYTARSQAAAFDDPAYVAVVDRYLDGTNPIPHV